MLEAPQAEPPCASWVQPHTVGRMPRAGESAAYARRCRHPLTHLYAKCSPQLGSWAGRAVRDAGWAGHVPRGHVPPQAGLAHRAATSVWTGWGKARTGPYRPYVRGRQEEKTAGGRQKERRREREDEREEETAGSRRRPTEGGAGFGWLRLASPAEHCPTLVSSRASLDYQPISR